MRKDVQWAIALCATMLMLGGCSGTGKDETAVLEASIQDDCSSAFAALSWNALLGQFKTSSLFEWEGNTYCNGAFELTSITYDPYADQYWWQQNGIDAFRDLYGEEELNYVPLTEELEIELLSSFPELYDFYGYPISSPIPEGDWTVLYFENGEIGRNRDGELVPLPVFAQSEHNDTDDTVEIVTVICDRPDRAGVWVCGNGFSSEMTTVKGVGYCGTGWERIPCVIEPARGIGFGTVPFGASADQREAARQQAQRTASLRARFASTNLPACPEEPDALVEIIEVVPEFSLITCH